MSDQSMTEGAYYRYHVFFCTNTRENGQCCGGCGAAEARSYAKSLVRDLGLDHEGGVRVSSSGCLNRCSEGPVAVIYPEGTWYSYVDNEDVEEIVRIHLREGKKVERLVLTPKDSMW